MAQGLVGNRARPLGERVAETFAQALQESAFDITAMDGLQLS